MANFYGTIRGQRGQASRLGNKVSGLTTHAAGWNGCIEVTLAHVDGRDTFTVTLRPWKNSGGTSRVIAEGDLKA